MERTKIIMKLKKWLPEYKQITYAEYKELPDSDRWEMEEEFRQFNRREQIHASQNWRPMTEEEIIQHFLIDGKMDEYFDYSLLYSRYVPVYAYT